MITDVEVGPGGAEKSAARVTIDGVSVFVARNDDGEVTVGVDTADATGLAAEEWPGMYIWINDCTLHAPKGEPRDIADKPRPPRPLADDLEEDEQSVRYELVSSDVQAGLSWATVDTIMTALQVTSTSEFEDRCRQASDELEAWTDRATRDVEGPAE
ncbi:MAG TPA: hypothetical protein VG265_14120 [Gaiellaceae bacterium]|jgi:hypothetical protein|nr:hypothetical protein [Gaiellaceae bacterium]